ncbi:MAG: DUF2800 domain-containing protein, partial [Planctomycetes bacterium]|nr:DUF2800 domain-containing protein [Planctomycetota bacterium]
MTETDSLSPLLRVLTTTTGNGYARLGLYVNLLVPCVLFATYPTIAFIRGPVRRWRISVTDLGAWVHGTFAEHVRATKDPEAPLVCSDQCRFCPAKLRCPAVREEFDD